MTDQQKGVITLIKSALEGKAYTLPEGFNMDEAVKTALRHKIIALVYYGAIYCGVDKTSEPMKKLFPYVIATMNVVQRQQYMFGKLCDQFEADGLDYMPMKGVLVQPLYPKPEMRTMGDVDILIRLEQYDRVCTSMQKVGFRFDREGDHEFVWKSKALEAEIHRAMVPSYAKNYFTFFGDGWKLAKKSGEDTTRYELSKEDLFIYLFVHFTKHYRVAGVGIKHAVDLWVYRKAVPDLDEAYICQVMDSMGLKDFYSYILATISAWFESGEVTDRVKYITQVLFESGEYGLSSNRTATMILMDAEKEGSVKKVRRRRIRSIICPSLEVMRGMYGILNKAPILLPVFWVVRWFRVLLCKPGAITKYFGKKSAHSHMQIEQRRQALEFVGLSFELEEKAQ